MAKTKPFDLVKTLEARASSDDAFRALVDAEVAALKIEEGIVALRKKQKLTQAALASRMGVTQSAIAQFEKRGSAARMEVRTFVKLVTAAGGTVDVKLKPAKPHQVRAMEKRASSHSTR